MTPLAATLAARIAATGPIGLDDFLAAAGQGYYAAADPFGARGDFVTAPEVSQMFGELIGAWLAQVWLDQGAPSRFVLAELGPGRGTLMADALRAMAAAPGLLAAAELWLVETSPVLRRAQAERLASAAPRFADRVSALPPGPLYLIANEFFDALPIRQHRRADPAWQERRVGLAGGRLAFEWGSLRIDPDLDRRFPLTADGVIVETCPVGEVAAAVVGARIAAEGGAALVIDYGAWDGVGDTLQALSRHAPVDPLAAPGTADVTAHVRFRALAEAASPARAFGPEPQGAFLERLGIAARAARLARGRGPDVATLIAADVRRLTDAAEMGTLFKALAFVPPWTGAPPGFADGPEQP
ncbi:SAM-dependent methyltransferase [Amaricoccus sp.]|uniref:class I SAM-dependent methyltransferase n=1 Tax=Amaricoccus sp. TaxID=1872485 RepID=UPI001B4C76EA|nr:SAM-dependent methyltransferase [Amaricoccus sp.]MBP7242165.1 SAM-dependent methyltransferase [Amaricoccus sp.]